jgi:dienelactone hydrolase
VRLAGAVLVALVAATAAGAAYKPSPLLRLDGAYRMGDGHVVSLAVTPDGGLLYTDTSTGDLRQLQPAGTGRFRFGSAYLVQRPVRGTIVVRGTRLAITTGGRTTVGTRVPVTRRRVSFRAQGVRIVGKVTSPATPGRHPALAIVHGSEAADRDGSDLLVNFYSALGYVVLSYDKRGVGDSTGLYVERATPVNVDNLAGDAVGALRVLGARRDVDPTRLGLVGGSQAGWIIPRAAAKSPLVRFAVITSGPAVSVGEQERTRASRPRVLLRIRRPTPRFAPASRTSGRAASTRARTSRGSRSRPSGCTAARTRRSTPRKASQFSRPCRRCPRSGSFPAPATSSSTRRGG